MRHDLKELKNNQLDPTELKYHQATRNSDSGRNNGCVINNYNYMPMCKHAGMKWSLSWNTEREQHCLEQSADAFQKRCVSWILKVGYLKGFSSKEESMYQSPERGDNDTCGKWYELMPAEVQPICKNQRRGSEPHTYGGDARSSYSLLRNVDLILWPSGSCQTDESGEDNIQHYFE